MLVINPDGGTKYETIISTHYVAFDDDLSVCLWWRRWWRHNNYYHIDNHNNYNHYTNHHTNHYNCWTYGNINTWYGCQSQPGGHYKQRSS